jgi:hypothetical protein
MAILEPNFSHRLAGSINEGSPIEIQLLDTIWVMAGRAKGVLASLTVQFEDSGVSTIDNELLSSALCEVEAEIGDMLAVVNAYWDAFKETKNAGA